MVTVAAGERELRFARARAPREIVKRTTNDEEAPKPLAARVDALVLRRGIDEWRLPLYGHHTGGYPRVMLLDGERLRFGHPEEFAEGELGALDYDLP